MSFNEDDNAMERAMASPSPVESFLQMCIRDRCTAFRMPDGQYYELKLMISILERDDMV